MTTKNYKKKKLSKNFRFLRKCIASQVFEQNESGQLELVEGKRGAVLEGGSRSAKTTDSVDTIIKLCVQSKRPLVIFVVKVTQTSFKTSLYNDFNNRLKHYGLPSPFDNAKEVQSFKICESRVYFMGADKTDKFEGAGCDYAYFNECLPIPQAIFDNVEMRCTGFWWMDFNPRVTKHWIFDQICTRVDVGHLRTTWKDNMYLPAGSRAKILSYSPYAEEAGVYVENNKLYYNGSPIDDDNQPPPHEQNIKQGTADMFNYKVYYHGIRCAPEGLILNNYRMIEEFPKDLDHIYTMDFGFTVDPTAFVKFAETETDIYAELLIYTPCDNPDTLAEMFESVGVEKDKPIAADSADKYTGENKGTVEMVVMLAEKGYNIFKVHKNRSVMFWLGSMKKKRLNIIQNKLSDNFTLELENYIFKEINGIKINVPDEKCKDHAIDATRYGHMAWNFYM